MRTYEFVSALFLRPKEVHSDRANMIKFALIFPLVAIALYIITDLLFNKWLLDDLKYAYFKEYGVLFMVLIENPITMLFERFIIALGIFIFLKLFHKKNAYSFYTIIFVVLLYSILDLLILPVYLGILNINDISYSTYEFLLFLISSIAIMLLIFYPLHSFHLSWPKKTLLFIFTFIFTFGCVAIIDYILTA